MELSKSFNYVKVTNKEGLTYDVGPFLTYENAKNKEDAINWVYRQLGIIMVSNPDEKMIKHRWNYTVDKTPFFDKTEVDIKVELAGFIFELQALKDPEQTLVTPELIDVLPESERVM